MARFSYEYVKNYIEVESGSNYKLLSTEYKNTHTKLTLECDKGHTYEANFDNFKSKNARCSACKNLKKLTFEQVKNYIEIDSNSGYRLLSTSYKNNHTKLSMICNNNHLYEAPYSSFQQGYRCRKCADINNSIRQTNSFDYVKNVVENQIGYKLSQEFYVNNESPMEMICCEGHHIKMSFGNLINGKRCLQCHYINNRGSSNPNWNPNLTDEDREKQRYIEGYSEWRHSVYERDEYTCQCCGDKTSGNLVAHHKDGYHWCKERRTDISNGVTLCEDCHLDFHKSYGYGENTESQFIEWTKSKISIDV